MKIKVPLRTAEGRLTQIILEAVYDEVATDAPVEVSVTVGGEVAQLEDVPITEVFRSMAQDGDLQLLLDRMLDSPKVFISHSRRDAPFAEKLKLSLSHELAHWFSRG